EARSRPQRPALVKVRHAPPALRAAPRRQTLLRALRRDLAPLDSQHGRRKIVAGLDAPDPSGPDPVFDAGPLAHAADDEGRGLPERARGVGDAVARAPPRGGTRVLGGTRPAGGGRPCVMRKPPEIRFASADRWTISLGETSLACCAAGARAIGRLWRASSRSFTGSCATDTSGKTGGSDPGKLLFEPREARVPALRVVLPRGGRRQSGMHEREVRSVG